MRRAIVVAMAAGLLRRRTWRSSPSPSPDWRGPGVRLEDALLRHDLAWLRSLP